MRDGLKLMIAAALRGSVEVPPMSPAAQLERLEARLRAAQGAPMPSVAHSPRRAPRPAVAAAARALVHH